MAKTAQEKVTQDLKKLPVDIPPPKPMEPKSSQEIQQQLADIELRADLDPLLRTNPVARLGWDILTRGEIPGQGPSGELLALIASDDGGVDPQTGERFAMPAYSLLGYMGPSDTLDPLDRIGDIQNLFTRRGTQIAGDVKRQTGRGIQDLMPTSEGTTVFYTTGRYGDTVQPKSGLMTLMHELTHVGMRELNRLGVGPSISVRAEELMVDEAELVGAKASGFPILPETQEKAENYSYAEPYLREANINAETVLRERGVPSQMSQVSQVSKGIGNLFGLLN